MTSDQPYLEVVAGVVPRRWPCSLLPFLEVPNGGVQRQQSSIQHQRRVLGLDPGATIMPPLHNRPLTWEPGLCYLNHFGLFLGLWLFRGDNLSLLNYILALPILFPLLVREVRLGRVCWKRSERFGLNGHLRHRASYMRLEKLKKACFGLAL